MCAGCGGRVACVACTQSGRAAAVAGTKRADTERAWAAGARARRRLGPVDEGGSSRWVGFAGLAQTTVERLLRLGDEDTADKHVSNLPPAEVQADARHVLGGECPSVLYAAEDAAKASASLRGMLRCVASAGGQASTLFSQLAAAEAYISAPAGTRALKPEDEWRAYQRVVAGDLDRPDWPMGDGDAHAAASEREVLARRLAECIVEGVGMSCAHMQRGWRDASRPVVEWRERREAGRGLMRVCLRAWREVADGVQAGAAAFEQRWRREEDCALARRLVIGSAAQQRWGEAEWLAARRVLTWMRLVRAGAVHRARSQNPAWRAARANWRERRYYHALPHACVPGEHHARMVARAQHRSEQLQHAAAASGDTSRDAPLQGPHRAGNDESEDSEHEPCAARPDPRRTRRTDYVLVLASLVLASLRQQLGGGHTRLVHARRKRGDG